MNPGNQSITRSKMIRRSAYAYRYLSLESRKRPKMALELEKRTETALGARVRYNLEQITREGGCYGCGKGFRSTA